jgi:hypothetical protein
MRYSIRRAQITRFLVMRLLVIPSISSPLVAAERYEAVFSFPEERDFDLSYEAKDNAVVAEFKNTHPSELASLETYDEALIRRVLIKDLGGQGTEVKFFLRNERSKVLVKKEHDPYRVILDFFEVGYREKIDPANGLPLVSTPEKTFDNQNPKASLSQLEVVDPRNAQGPAFQLRAQTPPTTSSSALSAPPALKLMIPTKDSGIKTAEDLLSKIQDLPEGPGHAWRTFPPYVYRMQTSELKAGKNYDAWLKQNSTQAMSSHEAMARYAGELFDFGHENRALVVYQKVLAENPSIFDKNADALWKLAEIHLGQGNLSLAQGYYEALQQKHPDSPLSGLAALRRLDLQAIKASLAQKSDDIAALGDELAKIPVVVGTKAPIALRKAYWGITKDQIKAMMPDYRSVPNVGIETAELIEAARPSSDSPRTSFLMDSILLSHKMESKAWNPDTASFAGSYLERYHGKATEPYRSQLLSRAEDSLLKTIDQSLQNQQFTEIASIVESLPKSLDELKGRSNVSWAAAEAYRRLQQPEAAIPYYDKALAAAQLKSNQFRAAFWLEQSLIQNQGMLTVKGQDQKQSLNAKLKSADQKVWDIWQAMKDEEKRKAFAEVQPEIEDNVRTSIRVKSSPKILLEILGQDLATTVSTASNSSQTVNGSTTVQGPSIKMIYLISELGKRLDEQGQSADAKRARGLLRKLDIKSLQADKDALAIWTKELQKLAEELREGNDYLEAGRIYALTGKGNNQWEGRAEALYKGGLLLFRSGRKDEAIQAFQEAASDGGNALYAELAKKRLEQIK